MLADGFEAINRLDQSDFDVLRNYFLMHEYIDQAEPRAGVESIGTVISTNPIT